MFFKIGTSGQTILSGYLKPFAKPSSENEDLVEPQIYIYRDNSLKQFYELIALPEQRGSLQ